MEKNLKTIDTGVSLSRVMHGDNIMGVLVQAQPMLNEQHDVTFYGTWSNIKKQLYA